MTVSCPPNMILVLLRKISYSDILGILGGASSKASRYAHLHSTPHTHLLSLLHTHANIQTDMQNHLLLYLCHSFVCVCSRAERPRANAERPRARGRENATPQRPK